MLTCVCHLRWRRLWRPSLSVISAAFIAFGKSLIFKFWKFSDNQKVEFKRKTVFFSRGKSKLEKRSIYSIKIIARTRALKNQKTLEKYEKSARVKKMDLTCLFAKTSKTASLNSSSLSIRISSSRASPTRSRSFESTTKIKPEKCWVWFFWEYLEF